MKKILLSLILVPCMANANGIDVRNAGMGLQGVATGKTVTASFTNPANVASKRPVKPSLVVPAIGISQQGVKSTIDQVERYGVEWNQFDQETDDPSSLIESLEQMKSVEAFAQIAGGLSVYLPSNSIDMALFASGRGESWISTDVLETDIENLEIAAPVPLSSTARSRVIGIFDYGLTLGQQYIYRYHAFSVGANLKIQEHWTYDYKDYLDKFDSSDIFNQDVMRRDLKGNADVGILFNTKGGFSAGVMANDLISYKLRNMVGEGLYELKTKVVAGFSYQTPGLQVGAEFDLSNQPGFIGTALDDTQWMKLGVEKQTRYGLLLRTGVKHNFTGKKQTDYTFGIGVPVKMINGLFDLAGSYTDSDSFSGAASLSFFY